MQLYLHQEVLLERERQEEAADGNVRLAEVLMPGYYPSLKYMAKNNTV